MALLEILLPLILFAIAFIFLFQFNGRRVQENNQPPSPPKLPIIGNLHQLGALPHRSLLSLTEKHGPLMLLHLCQTPTLIISSAEMAEEIMKTHDIFFASRPSTTAARHFYYGCTNVAYAPYGEYWRNARKICLLELLSTKRVNSFRWIMEEEVRLMMERISQSCSTGAAVNLSELMLSLSSGIITRVAFGKKYEGEGEKGRIKFAALAMELVELLGAFFVGDYFPSLAWVDVITGKSSRLKRTCRGLDAFLEQVIDDHLVPTKMNSCDDGEQKDLVDVLLKVQKDSVLDIHLTKKNIKAIILDMFNGGTDTAAVTLEWAMAELTKHPDVMEKAQAEVRRVVGVKTNVREEHIHQLGYLKSIIKETLRLHPVLPLLVPRLSTADVKIQNYHIPSNTRVLINVWAIGRDPKSWENAEEFVPERFVNSPVDFRGQDFQFIPFGAGRRGCPGISFGSTALELALTNLLYWYDWKLPHSLTKEDVDMSEAVGITVHKKVPLHLVPKLHFS